MSVYNDYMVKFGSGITYKAAQYSRLVQQGTDDCCLKRQTQILTMYWDMLSNITSDDCITDTEVKSVVGHITCLLGVSIGSLTASDILSSLGTTSPSVTVVTSTGNDKVVDVVHLDTGIHSIVFKIGGTPVTLGSDLSGLDYALSFSTWVQSTGAWATSTLLSRTNTGFSIQIYEDGVILEYEAELKT